jgi:hypothetical protein
MSRLDSFIRRLSAQRDILNDLAARLGGLPGPIFEFGLGGGRTYDHLRERFPDRRILVFESAADLFTISPPPAADLVVGDIRETAARYPSGSAALIHVDIETGIAARDEKLATWLPELVARLLMPQGFVASGPALPHPALVPLALPPGVPEGRYHLLRRL